MPYRITIADNFHNMDEAEYLDGGEYATYAEALARAHEIIDASLRDLWQSGMAPDDLMARYTMFGDDAFVVPSVAPRFSGREYARERAPEICKQREGRLPASGMP